MLDEIQRDLNVFFNFVTEANPQILGKLENVQGSIFNTNRKLGGEATTFHDAGYSYMKDTRLTKNPG
eukprot:CAMPEP_0168625300 /NCGR_PEP_ID=MMETSP0449_2-20121227/9922_1 /TAXON_ID=1082188 /ORGANISM="Strombidium rassoulzadegani, Strain ras09" /LENGTH=66 /DNA_ID=CAMNT_0008667013 /DNA_START=198 /DNA_END=398 /DNA_ORIENTATION=-